MKAPSITFTCLFLTLGIGAACGHSDELAAPVNTAGVPVEVHAHRGGAMIEPENSLVAFHVAIAKIGSDAVELDLHQTSDSQIVIHHDAAINPSICLDPRGRRIKNPPLISSMTLAEVQKYDCGTLVGLKKGTPLPTLDDVFNTTQNMKTPKGALSLYDLHIKWDPATISAAAFATLIMNVVNNHGLLSRVTFMNELGDMLSAIRLLEPTATLMYLTGGKLQESDFTLLQTLGVNKVAPITSALDAKTAARVQSMGIKLIPWIVNNPSDWEALFVLGVDGILTDDPLRLRQRVDGSSVVAQFQSYN